MSPLALHLSDGLAFSCRLLSALSIQELQLILTVVNGEGRHTRLTCCCLCFPPVTGTVNMPILSTEPPALQAAERQMVARELSDAHVGAGPTTTHNPNQVQPRAGTTTPPVEAVLEGGLQRQGSMNLPKPEDSGVPATHPDMCMLRIRRNHLSEVSRTIAFQYHGDAHISVAIAFSSSHVASGSMDLPTAEDGGVPVARPCKWRCSPCRVSWQVLVLYMLCHHMSVYVHSW